MKVRMASSFCHGANNESGISSRSFTRRVVMFSKSEDCPEEAKWDTKIFYRVIFSHGRDVSGLNRKYRVANSRPSNGGGSFVEEEG